MNATSYTSYIQARIQFMDRPTGRQTDLTPSIGMKMD